MKNILEIKNLKFKYPGSDKQKWHLDNVSLLFEEGKWTSILGPNGSGKSTIAKSLVRINQYKEGTISLRGVNIKKYKAKDFAKEIAYIPQEVEIPHGTSVYDFVSFGRNPYIGLTGILSKKDKEIIELSMKQTKTWEWRFKMMDELSGGQRQKVLIAMIVSQDAKIILLDEPTTYLDIKNQYGLLEMMHNEHIKGKTIITILHDINQAVQYSDSIYIIKDGKVYDNGAPSAVIHKNSLKEVYGVNATLYTDKQKRKYITDVKLIDESFGDDNIHDHQIKEEVHITSTKHK